MTNLGKVISYTHSVLPYSRFTTF